ncbi:hypothetical protein MTP99_007437 [Tenebrio molitor]|jgi:hypothetical protein|nr:hypothetical protein MTP99_007437 [Tenebrio molitor]
MDRKTMKVIEQLKRDIAEGKRSISRGLRTMSECIQSPKLDASLPKIQEQQKGLLSGSVSFFRSVFNAVFPAKTTPKQSRSTHEMKKEKSKEILKRSKSSDCEIILKPKYGKTPTKEEKRQIFWRKHLQKLVARWPHGCRRKYSEVAVPMLVGSNPTEGGGFFQRKETPLGHGCVCMSPRG